MIEREPIIAFFFFYELFAVVGSAAEHMALCRPHHTTPLYGGLAYPPSRRGQATPLAMVGVTSKQRK